MNALSPQISEALVGSTALSPIGADAEMIATCATFCDLERAYDAPGFRHETGTPEGDAAEKERERITAEQNVLVDRMCELPCTTLAGVQAMAMALATWDRELLKDGPAHDVGEIITSNMVERLLALSVPNQHPDAELIAACAEFRASEAAYSAIYDDDDRVLNDEECAVLASPIIERWDGMLNRMAQFRATTSEGLAARALALAQHSGIKPGTSNYPFAFDPDEPDDVTGRLLHMLLSDALRLCSAPAPNPDAELLAMRPELNRLHAAVVAFNRNPTDDDAVCVEFDGLCKRIMALPPAVTSAGRALQGAAGMHQMYYRLSAEEEATDPIWLMLKAVAGEAYKPTELRS